MAARYEPPVPKDLYIPPDPPPPGHGTYTPPAVYRRMTRTRALFIVGKRIARRLRATGFCEQLDLFGWN